MPSGYLKNIAKTNKKKKNKISKKKQRGSSSHSTKGIGTKDNYVYKNIRYGGGQRSKTAYRHYKKSIVIKNTIECQNPNQFEKVFHKGGRRYQKEGF